MRTLSIGDTHGRTDWKKVNVSEYDKIIFIGDYVDSYVVPDVIIKHNLSEIIQFKRDNMEKVVLLIGNHDVQYFIPGQQCSGYNIKMKNDYWKLFTDNIDLFQLAFQIDNYLWTHAGVHVGWWDSFNRSTLVTRYSEGNIAHILNQAYKKRDPNLYDIGKRRGGIKQVGGPLWCDKQLSSKKPLKGLHQIVGHTPIMDIVTEYPYKGTDTSITFIDNLERGMGNFYEKNI